MTRQFAEYTALTEEREKQVVLDEWNRRFSPEWKNDPQFEHNWKQFIGHGSEFAPPSGNNPHRYPDDLKGITLRGWANKSYGRWTTKQVGDYAKHGILLLEHQNIPVGVVNKLRADKNGLYVEEAALFRHTDEAFNIHKRIMSGVIRGMSVQVDTHNGNGLVEISLTTAPNDQQARIEKVFQWWNNEEITEFNC